jgi:hypothetical protein
MATIALVGSTLLSTGAAIFGAQQSKLAGQAEAKTREQLLKRKQLDAREAHKINTKRRLEERQRHLSKVRVQNAATGIANSGSQLAVFGEIESRLDESIDEATSRTMGTISNYGHQIEQSKFMTGLNNRAANLSMVSAGIRGVTGLAKGLSSNYDRSGKGVDPFSIFK